MGPSNAELTFHLNPHSVVTIGEGMLVDPSPSCGRLCLKGVVDRVLEMWAPDSAHTSMLILTSRLSHRWF